MPLNTTIIKKRLASTPWKQKDNEAQNIINGATSSELKSLDAEGVTRIYAAEKKRLDWYERHGIDDSTVGRGQLGQPAYTDVKKTVHFKTALESCLTQVFLARLLNRIQPSGASALGFDMKTYRVKVPVHYSSVWTDRLLKTDFRPLEDFVVAAYLAIKIISATKAGRSSKDTARFAVALYHGKRGTIVDAQTAAKDVINWAPVAAELKKKGFTDWVDYVNEVVI